MTQTKEKKNEIKNIFNKRFENIFHLHIKDIQISEFITRGQFVDEEHVVNLSNIIKKEGYMPGAEVWVNGITGANGEILHYRLIAGRHRYEVCKRLGIKKIPCIVFNNLSNEEECIADRINNEKDLRHKPVHFIYEAEHCAYLHKVKGISLEEIARLKNVSKSTIHYRIRISELSEDVKVTFVTVHHGEHFKERHARELCKLSSQFHQLLICQEINVRSKIAREYIAGHNCDQTDELPADLRCVPMTFSEIKSLVRRFKNLEEKNLEINDMADLPDEPFNYSITFSDKINPFFEIIEEPLDIPREKINISAKISERREHKGIRFGITPMWLRHTNLASILNSRAYHLLYELVTYDFRFKPDKDGYFFINTPVKYENCFDFLGNMVGTKGKTVVKKLLPLLKDFVSHKKYGKTIKFQINWDNLFEVYREFIHDIPFSEGGLLGIEEDATGILKPTPYHTIYIQDGEIKFINKPALLKTEDNSYDELELETDDIKEDYDLKEKTEKKPIIPEKLSSDKSKLSELPEIPEEEPIIKKPPERLLKKKSPKKEVSSEKPKKLIKKLQDIGVSKSQIKKCMKNIELTENVLKYFDEMPSSKKAQIENKAGYICKMIVKKEFTPPDTFVPQEAVEESTRRRIAAEAFGRKLEKKFRSGEITHFIPVKGKRLPITLIPNNTMFLYINQKGQRMCGIFRDWMEDKYFQ